ncbi:DUF4810 domain-containing protein [Brevundimonas naejangsanensis]|uniref:DUF4810 domain-containing protein n=1 Tax=Brevundimonas naejangsanensis TaxID=588932 RepID=UPI00106C235C|nr:DUF4810 domain-containing protein [Brevundimonas naejangsanensis]QBQ48831.1 DUF4810 domain-containing protein [Brevundimonas naejangsanensis]
MKRLMMMAAVMALTGVAACAPATRFEWGAYEPALYAYAQNPENREAYRTALERAIEAGRERDAVAPGLLAELGYLHLQAGETAQALTLFQEERARFPESAVFMDRVIVGLGGQAAVAGGEAQ